MVSVVKEWKIILIGAIVMFVAGASMFLWANSLEIQVSVLAAYSGYILTSSQFFVTVLAGLFFVGVGSGLLICSLVIHQLEKKL